MTFRGLMTLIDRYAAADRYAGEVFALYPTDDRKAEVAQCRLVVARTAVVDAIRDMAVPAPRPAHEDCVDARIQDVEAQP